jgi:hypothetical protein
MNLFYLDEDLDKCAEYHVDKHIIKMPLEAAQLLCTAIWVDQYLGFVPRALNKEERKVIDDAKAEVKHLEVHERSIPYLATMYNHPCTIWVRSSLANFEWAHCYANALNDEYYYRYGKQHKSVVNVINKLPYPQNMEDHGFTTFGLAMPDDLKDYDNPIESYRQFYMLDKATFASWKHREKPYWWDESLAMYDERITGR